MVPFDHFWEQPLIDMNVKYSNNLLSPIDNANIGNNLQYEPFSTISNF